MNKYMLAVGLIFLLAGARADGPDGEMRYEIVYRLQEKAVENIRTVLTVTSNLEGVSPEDIVLTIHSDAHGDLRLGVDSNGHLVDFPMTEELLAENPVMTHNQPEGSLSVQVLSKFKAGEKLDDSGTRLFYDYIAEGIRLADNGIRFSSLAMMADRLNPISLHNDTSGHEYEVVEQQALELRYTGTGNDHVHLHSDQQNHEMHPVDGLVTIPAPADLRQLDPWIQFCPQSKPEWEIRSKDGEWVSIEKVVAAFKGQAAASDE